MCFNTLMFQSSMQEIDFTAEVLDPRATLARASGGTRFNSAGTLETIGSNLPRFDYDPSTLVFRGVLVEEQRTNVAQRSAEMGNAYWNAGSNVSVTSDNVVSPDGTSNADTLSVIANGVVTKAMAGPGPTVTATACTYSLFIKKLTRTSASYLLLRNSTTATNFTGGVFNYATGTISGAGWASAAVRNGWYRLTYPRTSGITSGDAIRGYLESGAATATAGESWSCWGVSIEDGPFATSCIPTTSASATRYADDLTVSSLASIRFNPAGGTLYVSGTAPPYLAQAAVLASFNDNSSSQVIRLRMDTSGVLRAEVIDGGVTQASLALGTLTAGQSFKAVMSYAANDVRGKLQGGTAQADTSATIPTVDRLMIGRGASGEYWNSGIKRLRIFPGPLADAEQASLVA